MEIRHIDGERDVEGLIRVQSLAWNAAYDEILPAEVLDRQPVEPTETTVRQWHEEIDPAGMLVAVDDSDTVRGFVDMRWGASDTKPFVGADEAGLKAIYVEPEWWGRGIGTALLEAGLELLPESTTAVRLEMLAENPIAGQFYEKHGFERTGSGTYEIGGQAYPTAVYTQWL